ncbi:MAG: hydantoinase B/oxoprolinase family protein [Polyangiales bacterium]
MNNVSFGSSTRVYETIGGGAGATEKGLGASGVHTHMTNPGITDVEILETEQPVVVECFALRRGSGGEGAHRGGDGLRRILILLEPDRGVGDLEPSSKRAPFGAHGGSAGAHGRNPANGNEKDRLSPLPRATCYVETPGGGGWGRPQENSVGR